MRFLVCPYCRWWALGTNEMMVDNSLTLALRSTALTLPRMPANLSTASFASKDRWTRPTRRCSFCVIGPFRPFRWWTPCRQWSNRYLASGLTQIDTVSTCDRLAAAVDEAARGRDMVTLVIKIK